ncbi:MAG TPA: prepilin-type N-terminal cleavage/methylation domain-containing protein [Planctomycetota bacterium]|jgi:general secretion pathway protein G|nr:prepilin-type N-terminal cleavage/methylation domain-containing protein [Planctomycetota bacterium]
MSSPRTARAGFTLVEIMIVVAILALLAAVALPQFTSEKEEGKASAMVSSLSVLRTAIDSYWTQHDKFPGQGGPEEFAEQLIKATNKAGTTGAGTGFGYGPYLRNGKLPLNPLTGTSTVRIVTAMPTEPTGTEAWIYASTTGEIRCNVTGKTIDGVDYYSF